MCTLAIHQSARPADVCQRAIGRQFDQIELAFNRHGGLLRGDEVALHMRRVFDQPISQLARRIVAREVIKIDWQSDMLLPMFQFDPATFALRPGCGEVMAELRDMMDDWDIAHWFATPCPWLRGIHPVDMIESCWHEVFQAARAVRFAWRG